MLDAKSVSLARVSGASHDLHMSFSSIPVLQNAKVCLAMMTNSSPLPTIAVHAWEVRF